MFFVKPEWVADSIAVQKRLPEHNYAICQFSPEPLHPSFRQASKLPKHHHSSPLPLMSPSLHPSSFHSKASDCTPSDPTQIVTTAGASGHKQLPRVCASELRLHTSYSTKKQPCTLLLVTVTNFLQSCVNLQFGAGDNRNEEFAHMEGTKEGSNTEPCSSATEAGLINAVNDKESREILVDESSGRVVFSRVASIPPGLSQSQMVLRLGSTPAKVSFVSNAQIEEIAEVFTKACQAFVASLQEFSYSSTAAPFATRVARDQVILFVPEVEVNANEIAQQIQRLFPPHTRLTLDVTVLSGKGWHEFAAKHNYGSSSESDHELSINQVYQRLRKLAQEEAGDINSSSSGNFAQSDAIERGFEDDAQEEDASVIKVSRRFGKPFDTSDAVRIALECITQRGFTQARHAVPEKDWGGRKIQMTVKWKRREAGEEAQVLQLDNLSLHQTHTSVAYKILLYFQQTTAPEHIGHIVAIFRVVNRRETCEKAGSVQSKGRTVEKKSMKDKKRSIELGRSEASRLDFDRLSSSTGINEENKDVWVKRKQQKIPPHHQGINSEGTEAEGEVEVCVLEDEELDVANAGVNSRTSQLGLIPKRLSQINPDVAKEIPAEILREVEEELSRGALPPSSAATSNARSSSRPQPVSSSTTAASASSSSHAGGNSSLKLNPTSLADICPDVAKEIPAGILREIEEELSKSSDAAQSFFTKQRRSKSRETSRFPFSTSANNKHTDIPMKQSQNEQKGLLGLLPNIARSLPESVRRDADVELTRSIGAKVKNEEGQIENGNRAATREASIRAREKSTVMPMSCSQIDPSVACAVGSEIMREVYEDLERIKREHEADFQETGKGNDGIEMEEAGRVDTEERVPSEKGSEDEGEVDVREEFSYIKTAVEGWVQAADVQREAKISALADYCDMLIQGGELVRLSQLLRFIHRIDSKEDVYQMLFHDVQRRMQNKYGKSLIVVT